MMPPPERPYDVAIAGAGLAGASLALALARGGAKVALLDPGTFPRDKLCGEFLSPECWGVLDRIGLAGAVERSGYRPIRRVRLSTPAGRILDAEIAGEDGSPGIGLGRSTLDNLLLAAARAEGVEVFEATRVGGPWVEDGRVAGLRARGAEAGEFAIRARVAVAADGRHSGLVKQAGTTRGRSWFRPRLFGLKRHLSVGEPGLDDGPGVVGLHLVPGGYGGTCRIEGTATNLCALLPESAVRARRGDLGRVAAECLGRNPRLARLLGGSTPAGEWKTVAGVRVQVSTPALPGLLFAGDAQGTVDPLGGQGMTMALLGAEALAPFVRRALASPAGVDARLQAEVQAAWHRRFDRRVNLCRLFHHTLVRPAVVDLGAILGPLGSLLLSSGFRSTRDAEWSPA
ncbi:NAD(P)/FAD-dependent oxidoreductase [Tundrisphaera sp. TA3]|uniref:NAD(P)/FAD-dependent oxidoreductase n=1 Tax=Tundrisphaera sp. TA3 TaxID=3435775 RepID=UPI003EBCCE76